MRNLADSESVSSPTATAETENKRKNKIQVPFERNVDITRAARWDSGGKGKSGMGEVCKSRRGVPPVFEQVNHEHSISARR